MALLFLDGFDKYGGANTNTTSVAALMAGEWTTISGSGVTIVAPLSATGQALANANFTLAKTLSGSIARIIGGVRFSSNLSTSAAGISFTDAGSTQCSISIATTGTITFRNSTYTGGTILGTGASPITANTIHYLEWDVTLGNSAAYNVYLDGVSIISGTGDTTTTANNTINGLSFACGAGNTFTLDDLYLFDTTGTTNNAVLLTSPRIETQLPNADSSVQFAIGAGILGSNVARVTTASAPTANSLNLRRYVPSVSCTLASITRVPNVTSGAANYRGVVYADSVGAPAGLLSSGSTVTGDTAGTPMVLPLTTPQSLTAGTPYWLGFMNDTAVNTQLSDGGTNGSRANATFASGAPGTAPAMTAAQPNYLFWGNLSTASTNWFETSQQPPAGIASYVFDATVAHEDLYNFPALSNPGSVVYAVAVKGFVQKSDSGTRTISFRTSSGGTDSGGSLTGQAPGTSFAWMGSFFPTDPATSGAWTVAALNLATGGIRNDS